MGEIQYIWADPSSPQQQVAISSIVQAMCEKEVMAIARWVTKDGMDPKMGVLWPTRFDKVDCLLWSHVCLRSREYIVTHIFSDAIRRRCPKIHICLPGSASVKKRRSD